MPRTKLQEHVLLEKDPPGNRALRAAIAASAAERNVSVPKLAEWLGIPYNTLNRWRQMPDTMPLSGLRKLAGKLGWDAETVSSIVIGRRQ